MKGLGQCPTTSFETDDRWDAKTSAYNPKATIGSIMMLVSRLIKRPS
jgi:hypothetical protein